MNLENDFWLREAQKVAKLGIYVYDINKDEWISSEVIDEIFGINDDYIKNFRGWLNIIHSTYRAQMRTYVQESINTGKDLSKEYLIVRQNDGAERWVSVTGKLYFNEDGMPEKLAGTIQDISELKRSEERYKKLYIEFERKEALLKSLINSIPDLIFYKDINSVYIGCNKAFEDFVGMKEENIIGYNDFELFDKEMAQVFRTMDLEMIRQGKPRSNEEWVKYPDGKSVLLDTLKTLYYDHYGNVLGLIGISRDITEKNKKEKLQKSIDEKSRKINELREYDKIKTEFFANISHELRTPINVIFSALQMHELKLRDCSFLNDSTDKYKYTEMMKQNCYRILRLINNLIDITKIDSGHFQINEVNCNIIRLIENVALSVAQFVNDKGLTLIFDTNVEEKIIACDPEKIERIILNLLSNAVKFTEPGGTINFNIEDTGDYICIIVKDNGRGIPDEKINHIFDRFVQVDKSLARNHEGSGIGLSIVKALVELHGGSVKAFSQLGKGSEFVIELPVKILERDQLLECPSFEKDSKYYLDRLNVEFSDIYF